MSFVDGFYTFTVALTNADRGLYEQLRVKLAKHPHESAEYLCARMLAFVHCYEQGLEFSQGLFEPKEPTIWKKDVLGELLCWIETGVPDKKKLQHALRQHKQTRHLIYFYEPGHSEEFCHSCLRGSNSNWVAPIEFFEIDGGFLTEAAALLSSRVKWEITIVDNIVYLVMNGTEFQTIVRPVNIWEQYQLAIGNASY